MGCATIRTFGPLTPHSNRLHLVAQSVPNLLLDSRSKATSLSATLVLLAASLLVGLVQRVTTRIRGGWPRKRPRNPGIRRGAGRVSTGTFVHSRTRREARSWFWDRRRRGGTGLVLIRASIVIKRFEGERDRAQQRRLRFSLHRRAGLRSKRRAEARRADRRIDLAVGSGGTRS